jgi:hypothetical protein
MVSESKDKLPRRGERRPRPLRIRAAACHISSRAARRWRRHRISRSAHAASGGHRVESGAAVERTSSGAAGSTSNGIANGKRSYGNSAGGCAQAPAQLPEGQAPAPGVAPPEAHSDARRRSSLRTNATRKLRMRSSSWSRRRARRALPAGALPAVPSPGVPLVARRRLSEGMVMRAFSPCGHLRAQSMRRSVYDAQALAQSALSTSARRFLTIAWTLLSAGSP